MKTQSLNGVWTLMGKDASGMPISVPASVPGYVHPSLMAAGIIEPYFWRDNAEKCQWVEDVEWSFTRRFSFDGEADLSRAELRIGGIDTYADVYLNGVLVCKSNNMFLPICASVSQVLRRGENDLRITVHPYKEFVADKPREIVSAFSDDRIHVRRIQCTFFWDWVNRFVSAGVLGGVTLAFPDVAVIDDVFAQTKDFCRTSAAIDLRIKTSGAVASDCGFEASVTDPDGAVVWRSFGNVFSETLYLQADVPSPRLWWPVGYGDHPLYTLCVTLKDRDGNVIDRRDQRIGIRTVRFERLQDAPGSPEEARTNDVRQKLKVENNPAVGESYTLLVNGERIFCKGGNWVPASPFVTDVTREWYYDLVRLAAGANMNCLRVWGGGIYESDDFYDACDEYGVMVLQDFMLSCAIYPDRDPDFTDNFAREVEAVILRLRSRTSLAAWLGNNENGDGSPWDSKTTRNILLSEGICREALVRLDPNRTYRPYCPYGGYPNEDFTIGDNHVSWWWKGAENLTVEDYDLVGRMATESPLEGYPLPCTLRKFLDESDFLDFDSPVVDYHIKNNYYMQELGWPTVHERLKINAKIMVGTHADAYRQLYRLSYIQYEWARFTLEGARRTKWYSAGTLYWMYNDCWPALGYAVVDYYRRPKAGWYATKYSGASIAGSIVKSGEALEFILLNDSLESGEIDCRVSVYTKDAGVREVWRGKASFGSNVNTTVCRRTPAELGFLGDADGIVFLDLYRDGMLISRARWYPRWLADLALPECTLEYSVDAVNDTVSVTCREGVAIGVAFDGEMLLGDNYFDLLAGETKTVSFERREGFGTITAYAYNAAVEIIK